MIESNIFIIIITIIQTLPVFNCFYQNSNLDEYKPIDRMVQIDLSCVDVP